MGCLTAAIYTAFLYDIDSSIENENVKVEVDTYLLYCANLRYSSKFSVLNFLGRT